MLYYVCPKGHIIKKKPNNLSDLMRGIYNNPKDIYICPECERLLYYNNKFGQPIMKKGTYYYRSKEWKIFYKKKKARQYCKVIPTYEEHPISRMGKDLSRMGKALRDNLAQTMTQSKPKAGTECKCGWKHKEAVIYCEKCGEKIVK